MKNSNLSTRRLLVRTLPILLLGMACAVTTAQAVPEQQVTSGTATQEVTMLPAQSLDTLFEYRIENRPDPFVPFITEKATSTNINEIIPVAEQLSGMQLFEPGQLNLVAIVMVEDNDFAMAEDTTGKGYILHPGMKIGKRGVITAIQNNQVIVEETAFTRAGKKLTNKIVMLLKKEGEE